MCGNGQSDVGAVGGVRLPGNSKCGWYGEKRVAPLRILSFDLLSRQDGKGGLRQEKGRGNDVFFEQKSPAGTVSCHCLFISEQAIWFHCRILWCC